jgi:hypothetical protein
MVLACLALVAFFALAAASFNAPTARAQACPPYCGTPIITPAWHLHMCDMSYQEQLSDNHCMQGPGVLEFPAGTDNVHIIYCHKYSDTVVVQIKDSGGGLDWVNHPDGETYTGDGCESLVFSHKNGIPSAGSPYYTSAYWPEGPFSGVSSGIEWYIGLFVAFDQDNYYGKDAEGIITARDPAANQDPTRLETIVAHVTSTSDPVGIDVTLREQASGYPLFSSDPPLHFSTIASNQAQGVIKVSNRDTLTVTYCPRNCQTPYTDTATWYQLVATVTPTSLPTWSGPPPTATATPPPGREVDYQTLRPAPADVGYAPQISTNKGRPNHLGYPTIYSGMWTRGTNSHFGLVQFDLSAVPEGVNIIDARLDMVGRESRFTKPGSWAVKLLDRTIDAGWRDTDYNQLQATTVLAQIGPTLTDVDLAVGRTNSFGFTPDQLGLLNDRLASTRKLSFRVDGPGGEDNNLFAWQSGVDVYNRDTSPPDPSLGPSLHLAYEVGPPPTATRPGGETNTAVPSSSPTRTPGPGTPSATSIPGVTNTAGPSPTPTRTPGPGTPSATSLPGETSTVGPSPSPTRTPGPGTPSATSLPGVTSTAGPSPSPTHTPDISTPGSGTPGSGTPGPGTRTPGSGTPGPGTSIPPTDTPRPGQGTPTAIIGAPTANYTPTPTAEGPATQRQVCMVAWVDADGDALREPEERFLAGVTVRLTHVRSGAFINRTTDGTNDPDYCWDGLINGDYTISASALPAGYSLTVQAQWQFSVPFPGPAARYMFGARRGPPPTAAPTLSPTPAPTDTPAPTPTPSPQPTVVGPAGDLCASVFDDRNGNRFLDAGEPLLGDVRIAIKDEQQAVAREVLSRLDGPVCAHVAAGVYYVHPDSPPPGWVATSPEEQAVLVTQNGQQTIAFGRQALRQPRRIYLPAMFRPRSGTPTPTHVGR